MERANHKGGVSAEAQRLRLIAALRKGPVTTLEARRDLDILMPGARIHELRHKNGFKIETFPVNQETDCGVSHRVGMYVLMPGDGGQVNSN
jgi:hypothetical protein